MHVDVNMGKSMDMDIGMAIDTDIDSAVQELLAYCACNS